MITLPPGRPRLTYSSVIHALVEQITARSPFLQDTDDGDRGKEKEDIALLYRNEIRTGNVLGNGNFSNVFAVIGLDLREQDSGQDSREVRGSLQSTSSSDRRMQLRFELRDESKHNPLCVKCLKPELLDNKSPKVFLEAAADLVIEAKYLTKLNHENIIKVRGLAKGWEAAFENGEYDSFFLLVDRLEETLNQRIKRWRNGEFPTENTIQCKLPLLRQLASALNYLADRNLLFRDCKPQNIGLVRKPDDGSLSVKLFDFGFCRELPAIEQARDDTEDTASSSKVSTLKSGEQVFLMSGKGTRRYMAPEVLLHNRYNLKADVYSWAMVAWETLTLHKPYYKISKDEHVLHVCRNGDRPPLEPSSSHSLWATASIYTPSMSLSSKQSHQSAAIEASINFQDCMTDPIRWLLLRAWHQDVTKRFTMKQVLNSLNEMDDAGQTIITETSPQQTTSNDVSASPMSGFGYSCLLSSIADYGDVRDMVVELANDLPDLPFLTCFGHNNTANKEQENIAPEPNAACRQGAIVEQHAEKMTTNSRKREPAPRADRNVLTFPGSRIQTIIV